MKAYIFTLEALLAVVITFVALSLLETRYAPQTTLTLHRNAQDSLAMLKMSDHLQTRDPTTIEKVLNKTTPHHRLTIYEFNILAQLQGNQTLGEVPDTEVSVATATWVDTTHYYLAVLEVWQ